MEKKQSVGFHPLLAQVSLSLVFMCAPGKARAQPKLETTERAGGAIEVPIELPTDEVMTVGRAGTAPAAEGLPLEEPLNPDMYICGSGDSFEVRFWGKQNLSIRVTTDLEGNTFIPKVGKVRVAGKSLSQARRLVLSSVRRYYPGLKTDLALLKARRFMVHVVGDVKEPGLYEANARRRASSIIAEAGGSTGSQRRIEVRRKGKQISVDLMLYRRTGETQYNPYLLDGDVVHVPKAALTVVVAGPVRDPGSYELISSRDIAELLDLAGGLKSSVSRTLPIRVVRRNRQEQNTTIALPFAERGRAPNIRLRDDDHVYIPSTIERERSIALVGAVVGADPADPATTIKRLAYVEGDTVRTLIERAGGVTVGADLENAYIQREGEPLQSIDLEALLVRRDFRGDRQVRIGDTLVVPFKRRSVVVEGAVVRAGNFQFNPHFRIREYLASAGGTTRYARDADEIRLIGADGKTRAFSEDLKVRPGDTIVVPERNFSRAEIVQLVMSGAGLVLSAAALTYAATR